MLEEASVLAGLQFLKVGICMSFFAFCPSFFFLEEPGFIHLASAVPALLLHPRRALLVRAGNLM